VGAISRIFSSACQLQGNSWPATMLLIPLSRSIAAEVGKVKRGRQRKVARAVIVESTDCKRGNKNCLRKIYTRVQKQEKH